MRSDATACNTSSAAFSLLATFRQNLTYKNRKQSDFGGIQSTEVRGKKV
jgi:hypothetical protein